MFRGDLAPEYKDNPSWGILWDPKYAGRLAELDAVKDVVPITGIYAGFENPFDPSDEEIVEIRRLLEEQMPLMRFVASDMTTIAQALVSGEVVAAMGWNSLIWRTQKYAEEGGIEGAEFVWMKHKEGAPTWVGGLTIHPHAHETGMYEKCHDVIDAYISPEAGFFEVTEWGYGHANAKVYQNDRITTEYLESIGLGIDVESFLANGTFSEPLEHEDELVAIYEEVRAGMV